MRGYWDGTHTLKRRVGKLTTSFARPPDILLSKKALKGADLSHAYLFGLYFENVDLSNADLSGENLRGINLDGANLTDVQHMGNVIGLSAAKNRHKAIGLDPKYLSSDAMASTSDAR